MIQRATSPGKTAEEHEAVLIISLHSKVPWSPSYVTRTSQHAFISSQTLQDVYAAIPCVSRSFPSGAGIQQGNTSCVICIENLAYSGEAEMDATDYARQAVLVH